MEIEIEHLPKVGFSTELHRHFHDNETVISLQNHKDKIIVHFAKYGLTNEILVQQDVLIIKKVKS